MERLLGLLKHKLANDAAPESQEEDAYNARYFELRTITLALQRASAHHILRGVLNSPKYELIPSLLHIFDDHSHDLQALVSAIAILVNLGFDGNKPDEPCLDILVSWRFHSHSNHMHSDCCDSAGCDAGQMQRSLAPASTLPAVRKSVCTKKY